MVGLTRQNRAEHAHHLYLPHFNWNRAIGSEIGRKSDGGGWTDRIRPCRADIGVGLTGTQIQRGHVIYELFGRVKISLAFLD